jgi:hypothetical protein
MSMTQDRLRATVRAMADAVPDHAVPPLDLSRLQGQRSDPSRRPSWPRLAAPLVAAAAVIAVAATSVAVWSGAPGSHQAASSSLLDRVPRYYLALIPVLPRALSYAVIRNTTTGKTLATVKPPKPFNTFSAVAAAPDDRTFVLEAQALHSVTSARGPARLYSLRFDPSRGSFRLDPLPVPGIPTGTFVEGLTLSPDGTDLAVALTSLSSLGTNGRTAHVQIKIYSLASNSRSQQPLRVWSGPTRPVGFLAGTLLSWARTGALAFNWQQAGTQTVRLLDTHTGGGSLLGDSRVALTSRIHMPFSKNYSILSQGLLTTDGTMITAVRYRPGTAEFMEFSARTGKLVRTVLSVHGLAYGGPPVVWASSSGRVFIGWGPAAAAKKTGRKLPVLGVLRRGKFTPISGAPSYHSAGLIAF